MKLTLSYVGSFVLAGALIVAIGWAVVLMRQFLPPLNDMLRSMIPWQYRQFLRDYMVPGSVGLILVLLVVGFLVGWFVAGRMLAPLTRIGEVARLASQGSLAHRVALDGRQDEFSDLADVFDSMLDRVQAQVAEQQRFAANASHELRTPLAIAQTLLEVAESDPERDVDALISRLQQVNARAIELTEALLLLARADGQAFERERLDLSLLLEEATENLLPLAEKRGIDLESMGAPAPVVGSPALLLQLMTNLMHNAIVHNIGRGGYVGVRLSVEADAVVLAVGNTGALIAPELLTTLAEPFSRGAGRTRRTGGDDLVTGEPDHGGLGLGLAIARSIAHAHGAAMLFTARPEGGLLVEVRFPRAG